MKYYESLLDKYGFEDGAAVPDGIEQYRTVYIHVMNKLLEEEQSAVRLLAFDRSGMHNPYLILFVNRGFHAAIPDPTNGDSTIEIIPVLHKYSLERSDLDEAYYLAENRARDLDVDMFLSVTVTIDENALADFLEETDE